MCVRASLLSTQDLDFFCFQLEPPSSTPPVFLHAPGNLYQYFELKLLGGSRSPWKQKSRETHCGGLRTAPRLLWCLHVELSLGLALFSTVDAMYQWLTILTRVLWADFLCGKRQKFVSQASRSLVKTAFSPPEVPLMARPVFSASGTLWRLESAVSIPAPPSKRESITIGK